MNAPTALLLFATASLAAAVPETVDLRIREAPLLTLIERIARQCGTGLLVDAAVSKTMARTVSIDVRDVPWPQALDFMREHHNLVLLFEDGRLRIRQATSTDSERVELRRYDVRMLTWGLSGHPGPSLQVPEPGGFGAQLVPSIVDEGPSVVMDFIDTIQNLIPEHYWNIAGTGMDEWDGQLVVTQVPEVHAMIERLISAMARTAARLVEVRLWRLPATALGDHGPVIDAATWAGLSAELSGPVACFLQSDESRQHHFAGTQTPYLADADVVGNSYDPVMTIRSSGLVLDLESRVTKAGVLATLRFERGEDFTITTSPLRIGERTLGTLTHPQRSNTIQQDTRLVPPGGALLIPDEDALWAVHFTVRDYPPPSGGGAKSP